MQGGQHLGHIAQRLIGLRFDSSGKRIFRAGEIPPELAGQENKAIRLDGVTAWRNRLWKTFQSVELGLGHRTFHYPLSGQTLFGRSAPDGIFLTPPMPATRSRP